MFLDAMLNCGEYGASIRKYKETGHMYIKQNLNSTG